MFHYIIIFAFPNSHIWLTLILSPNTVSIFMVIKFITVLYHEVYHCFDFIINLYLCSRFEGIDEKSIIIF